MVNHCLQIDSPGRIVVATIMTGVKGTAAIEIIVTGIGIGIAIEIEIEIAIEIVIVTGRRIETAGIMGGIEMMDIGSEDRDVMMILHRGGGDRRETVTVIKSQSWRLLYGNGHSSGTYWHTMTCNSRYPLKSSTTISK
jgi:hypothetical protein